MTATCCDDKPSGRSVKVGDCENFFGYRISKVILRGCCLHRHDLHEITIDLNATRHERLHHLCRVSFDEKGASGLIAQRDRGVRAIEVAEFKVGARYAYGAKGVAPVIPPGADLMFSVEILDLKGNMLTDNSFSD